MTSQAGAANCQLFDALRSCLGMTWAALAAEQRCREELHRAAGENLVQSLLIAPVSLLLDQVPILSLAQGWPQWPHDAACTRPL